MNQILDYNPNKTSGGGKTAKSDVVVRVFAILLALFAIVLLVIGVMSILKNKKTEEQVIAKATQAKIEVTQGATQTDNTLKIKISHDKAIDKIIYNWDQTKDNAISCNGETEIETEINLLAGSHDLTIKVVDRDGVESTYSGNFTSDVGEDKEKPTINTEVVGNKLVITATDETAIDFVTYRWNDEEETKVVAESEEQTTITFDIEILKGQNDLMIIAVDKSNNSESKEASYTGVTKPDILITVSADKSHVDVRVTHDVGIKEILLEINGQNVDVDIGDQTPADASFGFNISGSRNNVKVVAVSVDNTRTEVEEEIVNENVSAEDVRINIEQDSEDKHKVNVSVESPSGIKEMVMNLNDVDIPINLGDAAPEEVKTASFNFNVGSGNNKITINIVRPDGMEKHETKEIYCED